MIMAFGTTAGASIALVLAVMAAPAAGQAAEDDVEIRNVMARYTWALDGKDAQTYSSVFAPMACWCPVPARCAAVKRSAPWSRKCARPSRPTVRRMPAA
jgi:hypothetical protein